MSTSTSANSYVAVIWEAKAKPGKEAEMKSFLAGAITQSRNDAGNIEYESHEVVDQPGTFIIFERWVSRGALDAHLHAPRMEEMVPRLLELMEGSIETGIRLLRPFRPAQ